MCIHHEAEFIASACHVSHQKHQAAIGKCTSIRNVCFTFKLVLLQNDRLQENMGRCKKKKESASA